MDWNLESGANSNIALVTKVRLSRNVDNATWNNKTFSDIEEVEQEINSSLKGIVVNKSFKAYKVNELSDNQINEYALNGYIDVGYKNARTHQDILILSDDEKIIIYLNPDKHLAIKIYNPGDNINATFNLASQIDMALANIFGYTINENNYVVHGDTGVYVDFTVKLFLPSLTTTKQIGNVMDQLKNMEIYTRVEENNIYKILINTKDELGVNNAIDLLQKGASYAIEAEIEATKKLKNSAK